MTPSPEIAERNRTVPPSDTMLFLLLPFLTRTRGPIREPDVTIVALTASKLTHVLQRAGLLLDFSQMFRNFALFIPGDPVPPSVRIPRGHIEAAVICLT